MFGKKKTKEQLRQELQEIEDKERLEKLKSDVPLPEFLKKEDIISKEKIVDMREHHKKIEINLIMKKEKRFDNKKFLIFDKSPDGLILYEFMKGKYKFVEIRNFKEIFTKDNMSHLLIDRFGYLGSLPFFLVKNNFIISLNTKSISNIIQKEDMPEQNGINEPYSDGYDLCYDAKGLYTILDKVVIENLTAKSEKKDGNFLRDNIVLIIIFAGLILLFFILVVFFPETLKGLFDTIFHNGGTALQSKVIGQRT